ncbi:MAG: hypothetical protein Q7S37_05400 [bacterium]|nr:hypothetical protein [bacterium]
MKKFILAGILLMLIATLFVFGNAPTSNTPQSVSDSKKQELIGLAKKRYQEEKAKGTDLENGPCLGLIAIGWIADIAHNPRQSIDDKPENMCQDYRDGTVKNFIELDLNGQVIRSN